MAHECPECGSICHCCGDIDDIGFEDNSFCTHFERNECSFNEADDCDDYDDFDESEIES